MSGVWYRFVDVAYAAPADEFGESRGLGSIEIHLHEYRVLKLTPKGAWIEIGCGRRFVLRDSRRRFACPTLEEARASFIARKKRQISIYEARASHARRALNAFKSKHEAR